MVKIETTDMQDKHSPIFVIGAPRTGSTILYQVITKIGNVTYIDNLAKYFFKHLSFGIALSHLLFRNKKHHSFASNLGRSNKLDLRAPSECGQFWYRWLPKSDHFADSMTITNESKDEIRTIVNKTIKRYQKSFLFKNLNAGQRIALLIEIFPHATFIWCKRNPVYTAQSIFAARKKLQIPSNTWWSIKPKNYRGLLPLPEAQKVVQQVFYLEQQIHNDLARLVPKEQYHIVSFEQFKQTPKKVLQDISQVIPDLQLNISTFDTTWIHDTDDTRSIANTTYNEIQEIIKHYNWETYETR